MVKSIEHCPTIWLPSTVNKLDTKDSSQADETIFICQLYNVIPTMDFFTVLIARKSTMLNQHAAFKIQIFVY